MMNRVSLHFEEEMTSSTFLELSFKVNFMASILYILNTIEDFSFNLKMTGNDSVQK